MRDPVLVDAVRKVYRDHRVSVRDQKLAMRDRATTQLCGSWARLPRAVNWSALAATDDAVDRAFPPIAEDPDA